MLFQNCFTIPVKKYILYIYIYIGKKVSFIYNCKKIVLYVTIKKKKKKIVLYITIKKS